MSRQPWDVVHVQSYHTLVAPLAMLRALHPAASPTSSPSTAAATPRACATGSAGLQRRLLRPLLRRAARLIAVARFEIEEYGGELRPAGREVRPDPERHRPRLLRRRHRPPSRNGPPTIASIGRLERYKGHHRVIAALPEVLRAEAGGDG